MKFRSESAAVVTTYLSVCSGIEAATVAWHPLGWTPAGFAEIEAFPSAVLAHRYGSNMPGEPPARNGVPNFGDITKFQEWPDATFDLLVGGTPCQSFSIAGLRAGLADPRGNLALVYLAIADRYRPEWIVWENVPGVLSSNRGRDFGAFLGALLELGYCAAWRVLDAQYVRVDGFGRAVPQRRRRVFVVGYLGDWRRAAAVLFERESLSGNTPPRREAGKGVAPTLAARTRGGGGLGTDFDCDGGLIASSGGVSHCLNAGGYAGRRQEDDYNLAAHFASGWAVRRLMPVECERLQGFPDGYTDIPFRGKPAADGPRYKALGNSMAVNVMRWLGRRIERPREDSMNACDDPIAAKYRQGPRGVEIANRIMADFDEESAGDLGAACAIVLARLIGGLGLCRRQIDPQGDALAASLAAVRGVAADIERQVSWIVDQ